MRPIRFRATTSLNLERLASVLTADPQHPHIHTVDMPYRLTSTWQDQGCEVGMWEQGDALLAWAVYQPPWWNLDYAIMPSERGSSLERELLAWGQAQMLDYGARTGEEFWGAVELFEDTPNAASTIEHLESLGFREFDWSIVRFSISLDRDIPEPEMPEDYTVRPLRGRTEVDRYVALHRAAFGSERMTVPWRLRTLTHPAYRPEIDLVVANAADDPVGFCICWIRGDVGQIEPLGVHPDYKGKGLGRALEQAALRMMRSHGVRTLLVDHVSLNEKAIGLSLQTGFKQINNAHRFYIDVDGGS